MSSNEIPGISNESAVFSTLKQEVRRLINPLYLHLFLCIYIIFLRNDNNIERDVKIFFYILAIWHKFYFKNSKARLILVATQTNQYALLLALPFEKGQGALAVSHPET